MTMKLLLYCTKAKPYLYKPFEWDCFPNDEASRFYLSDGKTIEIDEELNGKIVAECDFEVEKIKNKLTNNNSHLELSTDKLTEIELFEKSCLNRYGMFNYLQNNFTKRDKPKGYAIHIKNLHIFDEPRELNEYDKYERAIFSANGGYIDTEWVAVDEAPQNMMYCYEEGEKKVLISIRPQWLCKILNGEKTIEIRKKVLKEML